MNKIHSTNILNSRKYFLKRMFAWIGVKSTFMMRIFNLAIRLKKNFPLDDVEAVYAHFNVEREAENIVFIRAIFGQKRNGTMYDVGSNYMQFSSSLTDTFSKIKCFDPNAKVLELGQVQYGHADIDINNIAVIPESSKKNDCFFIEIINNSGLSSVVFSEPTEQNSNQNIHKIDSKYMSEILPKDSSVNDLLKIDVEGLECQLVDDAITHAKFKGIICFESLTKASRTDFCKIFDKKTYAFYIVKYNFSDYSGLMPNSLTGILKAILTNRSSLEIYKSKSVDRFDFDFIPLVFCVPGELEKQVDKNLQSIVAQL